ncbi:hypothetical protein, partial [Streptomyces lannensis]|uniref:hypothetical protein n=1 Tax=Streptomyces lannensis TaxID=766498 RepID=UPI0031EEFE0D
MIANIALSAQSTRKIDCLVPMPLLLRVRRLGSYDEDGLRAGAGRLRPGTMLGSSEVVVGHLA